MLVAKLGWLGVLAPPMMGIIFAAYVWLNHRAIMRKPLGPGDKIIMWWGFFFFLGMGYLLVAGKMMRWNDATLVATITPWGLVLAYIAWRRYQRTRGLSPAPRKPVATVLAEALPVAGLLVFLIASLIAWSVWAEGGARLWVPLLCTTGAAGMVLLARRDRRTTAIFALRGLLVLSVLGAIGRPSWVALTMVGAIALVLVLLEMLWKKQPGPSALEASDALFPKHNHPPDGTKSQ